MPFDERAYRRNWMRNKRAQRRDPIREERMLAQGKCPKCEILLTSTYHNDCPYLSTPEHTQDSGQTS